MPRLIFAFELTSSSVTWSFRDYTSNSLDKRVNDMNGKGGDYSGENWEKR
jgi:hypothetical protein